MTRNTREPTKFLLKLNDHLFLMGDADAAECLALLSRARYLAQTLVGDEVVTFERPHPTLSLHHTAGLIITPPPEMAALRAKQASKQASKEPTP